MTETKQFPPYAPIRASSVSAWIDMRGVDLFAMFDATPTLEERLFCIKRMSGELRFLNDTQYAWFCQRIGEVYEHDDDRHRELGNAMVNRFLYAVEFGDPRLPDAITFVIRLASRFSHAWREIYKEVLLRVKRDLELSRVAQKAPVYDLIPDMDKVFAAVLDPTILEWPLAERALTLLAEVKDTDQLGTVRVLERWMRKEAQRKGRSPSDPFYYVRAQAILFETTRILYRVKKVSKTA